MPTLNNTSIYFSLAPRSYSTQTLNNGGLTYDVFGEQTGQLLYSTNQDMNLQVLWHDTNLLQDHEGTGVDNERVEGDLVNVLFDVYEQPCNFDETTTAANEWNKICTIKKSKDVPVKWQGFKTDEVALTGHRFTINLEPILNNILSYSLIPPGIGAWGGSDDGTTGKQDVGLNGSRGVFGGMNGQWQMNTVVSTQLSDMSFNFEGNGTCRKVYVAARFELYSSDGSLELSTSPASRPSSAFWIYNGAPQLEDRESLGGAGKNMEVREYSSSLNMFMSDCPNGQQVMGGTTSDPNKIYFKKVRATDSSDYLQWFQSYTKHSGNSDLTTDFALRVDYSANKDFTSSSTVYLVDFAGGQRVSRSGTSTSNYKFGKYQLRTFAQNVSVGYINQHNNGTQSRIWDAGAYVSNPITAAEPYYRVSVFTKASSTDYRNSEYRYYELDSNIDNTNWSDIDGFHGGVKFMWLNRKGGIDSYTAERNISSSVDVEQDTITKQTPYSRFLWDYDTHGSPLSSRVLSDMYPHKREVLNVNANNLYTVSTDPLNAAEAKWLKSLLTSPNVWVVKENTRQHYMGDASYVERTRPGDVSYVPVLITNSSTTVIDESNGLSHIEIDFVDSNPINTQSN
jgi:hypothetical protein